jgi:hypothetical protein
VDSIYAANASSYETVEKCPSLFSKGSLIFSLSYQLKGEILEIYVLNSVRSEMFIA